MFVCHSDYAWNKFGMYAMRVEENSMDKHWGLIDRIQPAFGCCSSRDRERTGVHRHVERVETSLIENLGTTKSSHALRNATRLLRRLASPRGLRQCLGTLWLLDGLLQLQPSMFTKQLISGIMQPATQGQPGLIAATIQPLINLTAHYTAPINGMIALTQIVLGICLLRDWFVRPAILVSIAWSFAVWYGGEGLGMLLTGQASALTGAPGAVLLYGLLGAVAYPVDSTGEERAAGIGIAVLFLRRHLQGALAGFWGLAALLQMQPHWWQSGQISQAIAGVEGQGTLNGSLLGPSLRWLAQMTSGAEIVLNSGFIVLALALAIGLTFMPGKKARPFLVASALLSAFLWWATQACGQLLTGTATDVNTGPLLVMLSVACWPIVRGAGASARARLNWRRQSTTRRLPPFSRVHAVSSRRDVDAA
jgi:hypothetical protein